MKNSIIKTVVSIICVFSIIATVSVAFSSCNSGTGKETTVADTTAADTTAAEQDITTGADAEETTVKTGEATKIGEGQTEFTFYVKFKDGTQKNYTVATDETSVGAALQKLDLIKGEESTYGLYVKTVDGETADYEADGRYWSFYIGEVYSDKGVSSVTIVPGATYGFVNETAAG